MVDLIVFILLILIVYGLKRDLTEQMQVLSMLLGLPRSWFLRIYHLFMLPGVLLHEISHFFMAAFLNVKTGDIELFPRFDSSDDRQTLGSVAVAKTDPLRMSLIGIAPFFSGIFVLYVLSIWFLGDTLTALGVFGGMVAVLSRILDGEWWYLIWLYATGVVSMTMFISREDRRSLPVFVGLLGVVYVAVYLLGWSPIVNQTLIEWLSDAASLLQASMGIGVLVLLGLVLLFRLATFLLSRILSKKVVYDANR